MKSWKLGKILPFLIVDGAIVLIMFLIAHIDWIVNDILYDYGLEFSPNWAVTYWTSLRVILALLTFTLFGVTTIGYFYYEKAREKMTKAVLICKSCGTALTQLTGNINVKETLPNFKVLKTCPFCSEKLIEE